MKLTALLVLLLALQICAPASQVRKNNPKQETPPAKSATVKSATADASARTVVCVDPGHPSEVASGKNVQNGTSETHVDWAIASKLRDVLEARGYEVVLTKSAEDELVRNKDRALVANQARAALMIRLHCDASEERGYAVYYPDRQGRAKDGTTGPSEDVIEGSRRAAEAIHAALAAGLNNALNDNGERTERNVPPMSNTQERLRRGLVALAIVLLASTLCAAQDDEAFKKLFATDFSKQSLAREQLKDLDLSDLKLLRGVVFGRHGRVFRDRDIQGYLKDQEWYKPDPNFTNVL